MEDSPEEMSACYATDDTNKQKANSVKFRDFFPVNVYDKRVNILSSCMVPDCLTLRNSFILFLQLLFFGVLFPFIHRPNMLKGGLL